MLQKFFKLLFFSGFMVFLFGTIAWLGIRHISISKAQDKADKIIEQTNARSKTQSEDEKIIELVRTVFDGFEHIHPSKVPLLRIRPYLTNHRLPQSIRLPAGVIETNIEQGFCDNSARMLAYVLEQEGYESKQLNLVTNSGSHSVLQVTLKDDRQVFTDPYLGFVTLDNNKKLADLSQAKRRVLSGEKLKNVLLPLGDESDWRFYEDIETMSMALEGEDMVLEATLPHVDKEPITMGEIDGDEHDVKKAAKELRMNPYWYYFGHKYNREWVRILKAEHPVRVVMTLTEPADGGLLAIAEPRPEVNGKTLTWNLRPGETIELHDGRAQTSLTRMTSYIDVDQIIISKSHSNL